MTENNLGRPGPHRQARLSRLILRLLGWTVVDVPDRPERAVLVVYPHTSNWDFPLGVLAKTTLGLSARWAGKDSLFIGPMGPFMRWLGGIPINRREPGGIVDRLAADLTAEPFLLAITPEGTRSLRPGWKSGFYRIARKTGLPVLLGTIDYGSKRVGLVDCFHLSGDEGADMARIAASYKACRGKYPQQAAPVRLL